MGTVRFWIAAIAALLISCASLHAQSVLPPASRELPRLSIAMQTETVVNMSRCPTLFVPDSEPLFPRVTATVGATPTISLVGLQGSPQLEFRSLGF